MYKWVGVRFAEFTSSHENEIIWSHEDIDFGLSDGLHG